MTAKQFFKSTAFKCIVTLLCVLLVSGIFLTIAYGFLEVTAEEKEARSIKKIYGDNAKIENILDVSAYNNSDNSTIEKAYLMGDSNYLVKSTGYGGWSGGSVTCWVVVEIKSNAISGVGKVVIDSQKAQTLMDQYSNSSVLDVFSAAQYTGEDFESSIITGATAARTNTAITNSVNGAIAYVKSLGLGGGTTSKTPFDDFLYTDRINKNSTTVSFNDGKLTYNIKTKSYEMDPVMDLVIVVNSDKKIESFTNTSGNYVQDWNATVPAFKTLLVGKDLSYFTNLYGEDMKYKANGELSDDSIITGASNSTYTCMYAAAFALANYEDSLKLCFTYTTRINTDKTTWTVEDGVVTYTIKTKSYEMDPVMDLVIVVNSDKKIESFTNTSGNYVQDWNATVPAFKTLLVGKDLSYFTNLYGEDMKYKANGELSDDSIITGASNSTYTCMYAAAYALANYDLALLIGGSNNE